MMFDGGDAAAEYLNQPGVVESADDTFLSSKRASLRFQLALINRPPKRVNCARVDFRRAPHFRWASVRD